jgi:hypothetical protein
MAMPPSIHRDGFTSVMPQKVFQQHFGAFGGEGFWVILHPLNRIVTVANAHDFIAC